MGNIAHSDAVGALDAKDTPEEGTVTDRSMPPAPLPQAVRLNPHLRVLEKTMAADGRAESFASDRPSDEFPRATVAEPPRPSWFRRGLLNRETKREVMHVTFPRPRVRRKLLEAAQSALYLSGAAAAFVRATEAEGAMILVYHAVVEPDEAMWLDPRYTLSVSTFDAQMRYLSRYRRVVSMGWLMDRLERRESIPPGTVAITFDDGYLTTLTRAVPILKRYGLPAVTYLPTGYISREESQFADVLFSAFNFRTRHELSFPDDILGHTRLEQAEPIRWAYFALEHALLVSTYTERQLLLAEILNQLRPSRLPPRLTLNWEEVARMREVHDGMEIGLHTRDHIDLSARSADGAFNEIEACVFDAREHLKEPVQHFSYPFGRSHAAARAAVAKAGLRSAAVTEPAALVRNGVDRFAMPRLSAPPDMLRFPFLTGGAYPDLSLAVLRRA